MFCQKCGTENAAENRFCIKCGSHMASPDAPQPPPQEQQLPPPQGYQPPPSGYQPPPSGYQPPPQGYQPPPQGYQPPPQGYQPPQPRGAYKPQPSGFIGEIYSKAFAFLFKKPIRLWGLSLLYGLMTILASFFGVVPIIWLPIVLVLELGMASIYLNGYRGKDVSSTQLFEGFNKKFFRNAGGMGWRSLWILIWGLIPIIGFIFAIIKSYSYRFVPYIMLAEPDIVATEALKKSMAQTSGYKGKMFLADFLIVICIFVLSIIFYFIAMIPFIGIILAVAYFVIVVALAPLLMGILGAAYYEKIVTDKE